MELPATTPTAPQRFPLGALLTANAISLLGSHLTTVALPWFVLQTTGSAAKMGLTGATEALAFFVAAIVGGTLVDQLGYKRVSIAADVGSGLCLALVPLLYHTIGLRFWLLLLLVFGGALLQIPGQTARRTVLPELANLAGVRLERVNAGFETLYHSGFLAGPVVAGILIGWMGASTILALDAATFVASATILALTLPATLVVARPVARGRYRDELVAGLRLLRRERLLRAFAVSIALGNLLVNAPLFTVVLPVYARLVFGRATVLGALIGAFAVGSLLGAAIFGWVGHRLPRRTVWLGRFLLAPLPYWALAAGAPLPLTMAALGVSGLVNGAANPLLVTIRFERTPAAFRGRVFSAFAALAAIGSPIGLLVVGGMLQGVSLRLTTLALALGAQMLAVTLLFIPALRDLGPIVPAGETMVTSAPVAEGATDGMRSEAVPPRR